MTMAARALELSDAAEKGSTHAAYQLTLLVRPDSITELIEFISPDGLLTEQAFDAIADGFNYAQYVQQHEGATP